MHRSRCCAIAFLATAALLPAQSGGEGKSHTTVTVGAGVVSVDGDAAAFQKHTQHNQEAFGGIERYEYTRELKDSVLKVDGRLMLLDGDYRLRFRWDKEEKIYVDTGFEQFRVYYDGTGGFFRPTGLILNIFSDELSVERSKAWFEIGTLIPERPQVRFRYERLERTGQKGSTHWGDTTLTGTFGTRNIVPTKYDLASLNHIFTLDVTKEGEAQSWGVAGRYETYELDDRRYTRRRPGEAQDRVVTTKDQTTGDIFASHGFYERKLREDIRVTAGGLATKLDTTLSGSRIYGSRIDAPWDPAFVNRQARDEGYFALHGEGQIKQYVANLNVVYTPTPNWTIRPSLKFEDLSQDTVSEFEETNFSTALAPIVEEVGGHHTKRFDEFTEAIEVKYTRNNWVFTAEGEWYQGVGDVDEERVLLHDHSPTFSRESDYDRMGQKYTLSANWYAKPGLTFAGQYYFRNKMNDYDAVRDSTPPGTSDRYPAFITDQDFETHDFNVRVSWRPQPMLGFVTRYDYQNTVINTVEAGLSKVQSSELQQHIVSQHATWNPTARLYLTGNVNVTWDQMKTPAYPFVQNADNNYINGSLGAGYAVGKITDMYLDYTFYRSDNYIDNSATAFPFGSDQRQQTMYLTWVRRQSENLVYTVKYGFAMNRDEASGGNNDYDGHLVYASIQYRY